MLEKKQSGSALIITLLVITVVSAIVFSVGRLALGELKLTSQLEESDQAYYAAEAGIETGLLMFRFNHDVETTDGATAEEGNLLRVDLNTPLSTPTFVPTSATPPPSEKSVFDLKDWYKDTQIGNPGDIDDPTNPTLKKDEVTQISGFDNVNNIKLKYKITKDYCEGGKCGDRAIKHGVEIKVINSDETKTYLQTQIYDEYNKSTGWSPPSEIIDENMIIRIKPIDADIQYAVGTNTTSSDAKIGSATSTIEATGYFGGAKRKLQIKVDRTTGTILGLYDFTLLGSGSNGITVP